MSVGRVVWLLTAVLLLHAAAVAAYTKSDCYFPFLYNGTEYSYCTRNSYHVLWCSLDRVYKGRWVVCGPEVPKEVLDSIRAAVEEVGKEKAKLAKEQSSIDSVAKSVEQLSAANQMAHSNKSAAINALDQRLAALNRSLLQMELEQRNLDHRAANQESLRPLEIGSMVLLTVAVTIMGVLLYVFHCCAGRKGDGGDSGGGGGGPSLPETPQFNCLSLSRVQPDPSAEAEAAAATARQAESAKKFPGHFYHLTVDEEDEDAADEEEADDEECDTGDDASSEQHSRAAAALSSAGRNSQAGGDTGSRQGRFLNR